MNAKQEGLGDLDPERNKRFRDEGLTHAKCVEELLESSRRSREWRKKFNDPNNQRDRHLRMFHCNRRYPMSHQIQVQMTTLCDEGLLGRSFYDQFLVDVPKEERSLRFNQGVRKSVGRFISEAGVLVKDMKAHLGRWDPDLKAAAVAAKSFACIAQLICVDEMVELGNRLEAACLSGNDPIEIYGLSWRVMDFYSRANYKLDCLLFLANEALGVPSTPPPLPARNRFGGIQRDAVEDFLLNSFLYRKK